MKTPTRTGDLAGRLEGLLLILLGLAAGGFALFGDYQLLMNPKFRWLTSTGAIAILCMGVAALVVPRRQAQVSVLFAFAVLAVVVIGGQPHARNVNDLLQPDGPEWETSSLVIDDTEYTPLDLQVIFDSVTREDETPTTIPFVSVGLMKLVPDLVPARRFGLVRPVMFCCAADALMIGFVSEVDADTNLTGMAELHDQWVKVFGRLRRLDAPLDAPNLRHGGVRFSLLSEDHVIETIRVVPFTGPEPTTDILEELAADDYAIFAGAIATAGLTSTLEGDGPFTLFAPVDEAFRALPPEVREELLDPVDTRALRAMVERHVVPGRFLERDLFEMDVTTTLSGERISILVRNGKLNIGGCRLLFGDTVARNGVVHAVFPLVVPGSGDSAGDRSDME